MTAPPLIGRRQETAWLADAADAALAGAGSLVLLAGEAGVGKTHLAEAAFAGRPLLRGAAQVTIRSHARANRSTNQPMFVQLSFHMRWINMRKIFHGDFNGIKTPFLELAEQFCALIGKRRRKEKRIDSNAHSDRAG